MDHSIVNIKKDLTEPIENFLIKHTDYNFAINISDENYKVDEKFKQIPQYISFNLLNLQILKDNI